MALGVSLSFPHSWADGLSHSFFVFLENPLFVRAAAMLIFYLLLGFCFPGSVI